MVHLEFCNSDQLLSKMAFIDRSVIMEHSISIIRVKSAYLFACILLGTVGNTVVIMAILRRRKLQTVSNYFVLNLAIADLLFTVCGIPTIITTTIAKKWLLGSFVCDAVGFLNSLFCTTSIWTLVMISINRYLNVAKARNIKSLYTQKRVVLINIMVWVFSAIVSIPPLVGWSEFKSGANFCTINGKKSISYSIFIGSVVYLVPLIFLGFLYARIFFMLHKHEKNKLRASVTSETTITTSIELDLLNGKSTMAMHFSSAAKVTHSFSADALHKRFCVAPSTVLKKNQLQGSILHHGVECSKKTDERAQRRVIKNYFKEMRITKLLMLLVSSFFVCWTPAIIGMFLYSFNFILKNFEVVTFGIMCACLNVVLNPIIYAILNRRLRQQMMKICNEPLLFFICRKNPRPFDIRKDKH